ncbi:hypothetical protein AQUCO_01300262v1 [Aquilegia coerulea]|uniref:TIR domain-containing protein n=1 Tax=Aquilegia coerulea TaxID=218851 RepID=A0A2G5E0H4_AQUCA|nr:hypothetical protein AQUCO_01300262v1 [Aquilegia coerulea]
MELQQEWSKALPATTLRNLSSSSSAFFSANQSPFFSPRSPTLQGPELNRLDTENTSNGSFSNLDLNGSQIAVGRPESSSDIGFVSARISPPPVGTFGDFQKPDLHEHMKLGKSHGKFSLARNSATYSSSRLRSYDVYIGLHGRKPSLLRFANWLRAELEVQGISCFASDRARCRNSRSHDTVEKAMNSCTFGVLILTKRSFGNPYSVEELRNFLAKKNLLPIYFDMGPDDCLSRDIIEMRGELWEKVGGELWMLYGGLEKEWKEAVDGLSRMDEGKLETQDGNWRDCITKAVVLLATKLGRRSVVERVSRWKERVEKEEFPFLRNENFMGRKKELSELELMLFGNVSGDAEKEYFELKTRQRRKNLVLGRSENKKIEERVKDRQTESSSSKGKEPVIWRESDKEIEMQKVESPHMQHQALGLKNGGRYRRRKRSVKILYGKGIACVSGDSGIGKTELLLEFAYRFSQRYKMVLWIGGESRYLRQNYLNLWPFLEVDVGIENQYLQRGKTKSFEEQEEAAISRVRKELMRDIPFLVVIDNLESEKDWWDKKILMDLLPRFGGETHFIISTRLPRLMNLESLKLSYLSGVEAMSLMKGIREYPVSELDALGVIEEKLGRLTLGLGIVGAILSELPINPTRLLDTVNRMPLRDFIWSSKEAPTLRQNTFLLQLLEVCFSIFDHADGPRSLATRMAQVSGWFGPGAIPVSLLAQAANKVPRKHQGTTKVWKMCLHALTCGLMQSHDKRSEVEAASMLVRFGIARSRINEDLIQFHDIVKLYSCKRGVPVVAQAVVQAVSYRGFTSLHLEHLWAACFLVFGFGKNSVVVELNVSDLLVLVKRVVLPLAIHTFITFSRCNAALELLRVCTDALEAAEDSLVSRVEKWLNKPYCWGSAKSDAQLNPYLWQELAMLRAAVLETRAKLMLKGGHYDIADDLIRKTVHIRSSIYGENHPDTISARETQSKITRLLTNKQGS